MTWHDWGVSKRIWQGEDGRRLAPREVVKLALGAWGAAIGRSLGWAGGIFFAIVFLAIGSAAATGGAWADDLGSWIANWLAEPMRRFGVTNSPQGILMMIIGGGAIQSGLVGLLIGLPVQRIAEAKWGKPTRNPYRQWAWVLGLIMVFLPALGGLDNLPYSINLNAIKFLPFMLCMANAAAAMYHGPHARRRGKQQPAPDVVPEPPQGPQA